MGGSAGIGPSGAVRSAGPDTPMGSGPHTPIGATHGATNGELVKEMSGQCEVQAAQGTAEVH